jgi:hypothetical protein
MQTTYLVGVAFFLLAWACLYASAPRVRYEMICASLGLAHFGPFLEYWYLRDYWSPQYIWAPRIGNVLVSAEDYLFGFALAGLAAGIFALARPVSGTETTRRIGSAWLRLQLASGAFVLSVSLLTGMLGMDSVQATLAVCLAGSVWIFRGHGSWLPRAAAASCVMAALFWVFYETYFLQLFPTIIDDWWNPAALTGIKLGRVPLEEIAWAAAMGLFIGPLVRSCSAAHVALQQLPAEAAALARR